MQLHISRLNSKGKPCFSLLLRQATGIILIVICQALATETAKSGNEKCKPNPNGTIQQYTWSMYLLTGTAFVTGVVFIAFFKPKYKRLAEEEKLAAEKILRNPKTWIFKCSGGESQTWNSQHLENLKIRDKINVCQSVHPSHCHTFVSYTFQGFWNGSFTMFVSPTPIANFGMCLLVMRFILFVNEIIFMLI